MIEQIKIPKAWRDPALRVAHDEAMLSVEAARQDLTLKPKAAADLDEYFAMIEALLTGEQA